MVGDCFNTRQMTPFRENKIVDVSLDEFLIPFKKTQKYYIRKHKEAGLIHRVDLSPMVSVV